ncbi:MAG TPA: helix-turn-helix domain-containing protein [Terriglobia bacterium]|nr:helix-turn-helix domain-containing protein [Terriglobia bacterium]
MAKNRWKLSAEARQELKAAMKAARSPDHLRRLQCVWMPAVLGLTARDTASALGWSINTVWRAQARYRRSGLGALLGEERYPYEIPPGAAEALVTAVKRARTVEELRRIQCVLLRASLGLGGKQVAAALGWVRGSVATFQAEYLRRGEAALHPARVPHEGALPSCETAAKLRAAMQSAATVPEYRHLLCLYMRIVLGLSCGVVARTLGWGTTTVRRLHHRYSRQGQAALRCVGRGGARRHILSTRETDEVLAGLSRQVWPECLLMYPVIHRALEQKAHRPLKPSTVQALLNRHGWHLVAVVMVPHPVQPPKAVPKEPAA